ncbi:transcription antitermination factor NusB [Luteimonas sp. FXH3W]|uniref:Transcription antitermination protein NusB n=1 Tax=Aquilutibacter rugosus TaxID=3115820 RepID=A0ABU7UXR7_9GAMM
MTEKSQHPRANGGIDRVARARARRRALQALYAWQMSGCTAREAVAQFAHEQAREQADLAYFEDIVFGVIREQASLDKALRPFLDREVDEVDPIERAALRQATYELVHRLDVPYAVVINEAIEIVKKFGTEHGHTFVNGVLDQAAASLRAVEVQAAISRHRD